MSARLHEGRQRLFTEMPADGDSREAQVLLGNFYRGRIVRLRHGSQTGIIRAEGSGRLIPFRFNLVRLLGVESFRDLQEGMIVGFDVGWTSGGLRVSLIKVFSEEPTTEAAAAGPQEGSAPASCPSELEQGVDQANKPDTSSN